MVAIAVVIATKSASILISRLFVPLSKAKLDTFVSQFFSKLNVADQSTLIQGESVNFLFKPLDSSFFMILITTKDSNIVSDIQSLNLAAHILSDTCHPLSLESIEKNAFEIVFAIDEVFPLLLIKEIPTASNVLSHLAMDSANEKVEELITKDKEKEAKLKAKEKIKQLDLQRREAAKKASISGTSSSHHPPYDSANTPLLAGSSSSSVPFPMSDMEQRQPNRYKPFI